MSAPGHGPAQARGWFGLIYRHNLIYNQCWEDPAVDQHRVATRTATVTAALRSEESEPISAFVLLDHLDWLIPHPELIEEEWRAIFASAAPGARVIFRSGGGDAAFLPAAVRERLAFDAHRARQLHAQDRVATYGSFHIARLAPA